MIGRRWGGCGEGGDYPYPTAQPPLPCLLLTLPQPPEAVDSAKIWSRQSLWNPWMTAPWPVAPPGPRNEQLLPLASHLKGGAGPIDWRSCATSSCPCTTLTPRRNRTSWSRSYWSTGGTPPPCRQLPPGRPCRARPASPPRACCRGPAGWCSLTWPTPSTRERSRDRPRALMETPSAVPRLLPTP
ncbi:uncharacterized protein C3orf18 homolog isoform X1 [Choloepus didactylus]|uniref:uncharacterized protein C3orf18 homolog isoform X1 n=1 Tax=Choloepus didactylus TaxID=27675 RepID=UPI00189D3892|nr:uncharacterized protein C3orf18 homolog isoform X1 [Choloepus didactylus]